MPKVPKGRTCDGYSHVQKLVVSQLTPEPLYLSSGPKFDDRSLAHSRRSFGFFLQQTCSQFSGFFTCVFWETHVPQAAHHEPIVLHAVVALGSLHMTRGYCEENHDANRVFALEQYNHAIRLLLDRGADRGTDVCLMACILFTCFENMQGNHAGARAHIRSGAKLLYETLDDQTHRAYRHRIFGAKRYADCYSPLGAMARIFAALDSQTIDTVRNHLLTPRSGKGKINGGDPFRIPTTFSNTEEAKAVFESGCWLLSHGDVGVLSDNDGDSTERSSYITLCNTRMAEFSNALSNYTSLNSAHLTPKQDISLTLLRLQTLNTKIMFHLEVLPPPYQSRWETFMREMEEIVVLGEKVITYLLDSGCSSNRQATTFCSGMGYVIPLWTVASHSRDPLICQKAIMLLRANSRQEGMWNSFQIADAAKRALEIVGGGVWDGQAGSITDDKVNSYNLVSSPYLELDEKGGRLHYTRLGGGLGRYDHVVEEIFKF
ncbi:hypothetical protein PG984_004409 [Apiospora sp. TS-2023a]